jgi:hypothetical protein
MATWPCSRARGAPRQKCAPALNWYAYVFDRVEFVPCGHAAFLWGCLDGQYGLVG